MVISNDEEIKFISIEIHVEITQEPLLRYQGIREYLVSFVSARWGPPLEDFVSYVLARWLHGYRLYLNRALSGAMGKHRGIGRAGSSDLIEQLDRIPHKETKGSLKRHFTGFSHFDLSNVTGH